MAGRGNTNEKIGRVKDREAGQNTGRHFLSPDKHKHETTAGMHALHAQSSTETSGLGETMTSGFSSQDSVNSEKGTTKGVDHGGYSISPDEARATREKVNTRTRDRVNGTGSGMKSNNKKYGESTGTRLNKNVSGETYDKLFTRERRESLSPSVGLHVENIDDEWDKRSYEEWEKHSNKSRRNSAKSSQGGSLKSKASKKFLGIGPESAWMKWSRDRRASYRRRIESLEKVAENKQRTSTPVKKARQEGLKFIHPDLEGKYLSEDDINELRRHQQEQFRAYKVIEKGKKQHKDPFKVEVKLTLNQWHVLNDFWDHDFFVRFRWLGSFLSLLTLLFLVVSITNSHWLQYERRSLTSNVTVHEGLWICCFRLTNLTDSSYECASSTGRGFSAGIWASCFQNLSDPEAVILCPDKKPHWQNAVIGLMLFAATFGFVASLLSICGVCTSPLPRKIYYFHSAGEIFLVCALSTGIALIIFPIAIELDGQILSHRYGIGYGLGWGGAFFFLAAAICMTLDELVRESARTRICRWCWKGKDERTDLRQV